MTNEYLGELLSTLQKHGVKMFKDSKIGIEFELYPKAPELPEGLKKIIEKPLTDEQMLFDPMQGLEDK